MPSDSEVGRPSAEVRRRSGSNAQVPADLTTVVEEPWCAEVDLPNLDSPITPTSRFFVRSHFPVPSTDPRGWTVTLDGQVDRPTAFSLEQLRALPSVELVVTMECAGNSRSAIFPQTKGVRWQHGAVGTARWKGVRLRDVLNSVGLRSGAQDVVLEGSDRGREEGVEGEIPYEMSIPPEKALHPDTLLAFEMNGAPLTPGHGAPVRAVVPGWYGMASVKWLRRIQVLDRRFVGFFRSESYVMIREGDRPDAPKAPVADLQIKSLITEPAEHAELFVGRNRVRGWAWGGPAGVRTVEVSYAPFGTLDERLSWEKTILKEGDGPYAWRRWEATLEIRTPGYYLVRARAVDAAGESQPLHPAWNYRGVATNAVHAVSVVVRGPPEGSPGRTRARK